MCLDMNAAERTTGSLAELERLERTDTLPGSVFSYLGNDGIKRSDIVCAACLSSPETASVYAGDESRVADIKKDGEASIWHRPGDAEALTSYELSCSLCGEVIATEKTDEAYFAKRSWPFLRGGVA